MSDTAGLFEWALVSMSRETTAIDQHGNIVGVDDGYGQAVQAIRNIENALKQAGATLANVVRTRMFVTDITRWQEYGRAHREFFR